jgi:TolB-like protein
METLLRRLKQRKLVQWALAYIAAAFAMVQVCDIVANRFHWPEPVMRWGILALALGLGMTLVLAWYHGERGQQRMSGAELSVVAALLLAAGVGAGVLRGRTAPAALASTVDSARGALSPKTLAVLPFVNIGDERENAYFTDGIHEEILTALSRIGDLHVIGRTSVIQYRNTTKGLPQIARELGAGTVMEGSVQRARGRVHIEARLVDAATDRPVWTQSYDRDVADVLAVETHGALQIAVALQARMTEREQAVMAGRPTTTAEAYDLYLRARARLAESTNESVLGAERLLERVVVLDPKFAAGWGALARAYAFHSLAASPYFPGRYGYAGSAARRAEQARSAAETALRLWPDEADGHIALG